MTYLEELWNIPVGAWSRALLGRVWALIIPVINLIDRIVKLRDSFIFESTYKSNVLPIHLRNNLKNFSGALKVAKLIF